MTTYQTQVDPTAVMGRRIGAWIVDYLLLVALIVGGVLISVDTDTLDFNPCPDTTDDFSSDFGSDNSDFEVCTVGDYFVVWDGDQATGYRTNDANLVFWGVLLAYGALIGVLMQGLTGATPGKALFGIRAVNEDGDVPGIGKAFLRTVGWIVDALPYCTCIPLVAPIAGFATKGHRRVGDMIAKTFVVDRKAVGTGPVVVPGLTGAIGIAPVAPQPWGTTPPVIPPTEPVASPPQAGEPQWDPQRNAYIQWDATQQKWLQFDDAAQEWRPID